MELHHNSSGASPKEEAILKLIENKIATKVGQIESDNQSHNSQLANMKAEIENLTKIGTNLQKELQEQEAQNITPRQEESDNPTNSIKITEQQNKETVQKPAKKPATPTVPATKPTKTDKPTGKITIEPKKTNAAKEEEKKESAKKVEKTGGNKQKTPEQAVLEEGKQALNQVKKDALKEAKSLPCPPPLVVKVLEAVLVAFGEKSQTWRTAQETLNSKDFVKRLTDLDVLALPVESFVKVKQIMSEEGMDVANLRKKNVACSYIGQWLHSIVKYREMVESPKGTNEHQESVAETKEEQITQQAHEEVNQEEKKESVETTQNASQKQDETQALAALNECQMALNVLTKKAITEVASFPKPPAGIPEAFKTAFLALGEKPKDWAAMQKALKSSDIFLMKLLRLDIAKIPAKDFKKIKQDISQPFMEPENLGGKSLAAKCIAQWLVGVVKYREMIEQPMQGVSEEK